MDDYDRYNRTGVVTRDTSDWTNMPYQLRITNHPQRILEQKRKLDRNDLNAPTKLDEYQKQKIREMYHAGESMYRIKLEFGIRQSRVYKVLGIQRPKGDAA